MKLIDLDASGNVFFHPCGEEGLAASFWVAPWVPWHSVTQAFGITTAETYQNSLPGGDSTFSERRGFP
jgi:hypothetical protein